MTSRTRYTTESRNRLSDRDMLVDLLSAGKYMSHLYDHAIMESSSRSVRDTLESLQQDEHEIAETLTGMLQEIDQSQSGIGRRSEFSQRQPHQSEGYEDTFRSGRFSVSQRSESRRMQPKGRVTQAEWTL